MTLNAEYIRSYRARHPEYVKQEQIYLKQWKAEHREAVNRHHQKWVSENPKTYRKSLTESAKRQHRENRVKLVMLLGGKCCNPKCLVLGGCTDTRCLQIDHINGGGSKERKAFTNVNMMVIYYLNHQEEISQKLQLLCANCNWIKRFEKGEHN